MSFYSDASLVLIPSGYKDQKIYAAKPTDGLGDLVFSRASNATRVASNGLIEKVRTNLLLYSQEFDNAYWLKTNSTITANSATAPDGTLTADKVVENALLAEHGVARVGAMPSAGVYALSVFVKAAERTRIAIGNSSSGHYAIFDLSLGTVVQASSGTVTNGTISSIDANGYYRVSCTITVASAASASITLVSTGTTILYLGDGTSGLFLWGAQLETGDIATDYIPTTTAAVSVGPVSGLPRLDYYDSTCPRLLLEPQRSNLALFSEQWNNASAWIAESASVTANAATSPSGYEDADLLTGTGSFSRLRQSGFTLADNTVYTVSSFLKAGTAYSVRLTFVGKDGVDTGYTFNLQNGTAESGAKIENYGNGWYRCSFTANSGTGATTPTVRFASNNAGVTGGWTTGLTIYAWGAQLEAGAYATSYIPTLSTSVTRVADAASKTGISSLIGQTEGTIFIDFEYNQTPPDANGRLLQLYGTSETTDSILPLIFGAGANANQFQLTVFSGSSGDIEIAPSAGTTVPFGRQKFAIAYNAGVYTVYRNGSLFASGSGLAPASLTALDLGGSASFTRNFGNPINQALLFKTRLSNDALASLTTL